MEDFGKLSVRTSGLFWINELRMSEYWFSDTMKTGSGNCLGMTPSSFKSSRPTMTLLWIAGVMTALVLTERLDVLSLIGAVPDDGTGSLLMLIYFLCEGLVGLTFLRRAKSAAIRVAALPVSGNVRKLNDSFACDTPSVKRFTHISFGSESESATALIGRLPLAVLGFPCRAEKHTLARWPAPPQ